MQAATRWHSTAGACACACAPLGPACPFQASRHNAVGRHLAVPELGGNTLSEHCRTCHHTCCPTALVGSRKSCAHPFQALKLTLPIPCYVHPCLCLPVPWHTPLHSSRDAAACLHSIYQLHLVIMPLACCYFVSFSLILRPILPFLLCLQQGPQRLTSCPLPCLC